MRRPFISESCGRRGTGFRPGGFSRHPGSRPDCRIAARQRPARSWSRGGLVSAIPTLLQDSAPFSSRCRPVKPPVAYSP